MVSAGLCHDWYFRPAAAGAGSIGQGLGLGGEWGGAALLATEKPHRANVHCMAPFRSWAHRLVLLCQWHFLAAFLATDRRAVMSWGWRVPFIFSAVLVIIGLMFACRCMSRRCLRKSLKRKTGEDPAGYAADQTCSRNRTGTFIMLATYTLFYIMTVYSMTLVPPPRQLGLACRVTKCCGFDDGSYWFWRDGASRWITG